MNIKQRKIKIEPRIKLNYNIYQFPPVHLPLDKKKNLQKG